ncbi:MAG: hypothetical protein Q8Q00_02265 [Dehalococcoidia bacterium]|nr:hypothetical protein [Dehalococcoidia bacterium]
MPLIYEPPPNSGPLRQGEILADIYEHRPLYPAAALAEDSTIEFRSYYHRLAIVMTPDCDLEWDCQARSETDEAEESDHPQLLPHVLLCDVYGTSEIRQRVAGSDVWKRIQQNQDERYHHLSASPIWLPDIYMDFKKTLALATENLYSGMTSGGIRRVAVVPPLYLQDLTHRFYGFLSRVALPE